MGASGAARRASPLRLAVTFGVGFLLGFVPFLVPFLDSVTYLIPLSLRDELMVTTALLGGFIALTVRGREPLGRRGRRVLQTWTFLALPGLLLLFLFQSWFIVPIHHFRGLASEVVVAPPRLGTCPCDAAALNAACLGGLIVDPVEMDRCWDGARRQRNRLKWAFGYLLLVGGGQSFVGLLWASRARSRAESVWPATGAAGGLFLSYSRRDGDFAERLADDLKARGITVWWDSWEMEAGDSLPRKIEEAILRSAWFGIVLSPDAVDSPWVRAELEMARTREIEGGLTILPILYKPCEIPLSLRGKIRADFTSSYEVGLEALLRGLKTQRK